MLKNTFYVLLFAIISGGIYQISYPSNTTVDLFYDGMFFENIVKHIDKITQGPRAIGDEYHDDTERYLKRELNKMGLSVSLQPSIGFNNNNRTAAPVRNIIATFPGTSPNNKSLMLLAHYDAAKFSGKGAGDDASGVAIILESINALLKSKKAPTNNIVVLFTDGEEVGLLGAKTFINEQLNYHNVGLIINLEARGTNGPAMMWPETDGGNRSMIEQFEAAGVPMPVTTSLHYEIYKILPNDTDLTPFNQEAKINGFNFAFIDDHFNYHTQRDSIQNLSLDTLAHQSIQLYTMLKHFSQADLSQLKSEHSLVYFSLPMIGLISYSTSITWVFLIVSMTVLLGLLVITLNQKKFKLSSFITAPLPMLFATASTYIWCWLLVKGLYTLFPEFSDILQGFPYSGHHIMAAILISGAILGSGVYSLFSQKQPLAQSFSNSIIWFLIIVPMCYALPGSGLLIWPLILSVILLGVQLFSPKYTEGTSAVFAVLVFIMMGSLLVNFPIALGIKAIPLTAVIMVALMGLLVPLFNGRISIKATAVIVLLPLIYLAWHFNQNPTISDEHPLPTSLSYLYDHDTQNGYYFNYDQTDHNWNQILFKKIEGNQKLVDFRSRYKKPLKTLALASDPIKIPKIEIKARSLLSPVHRPEVEITFTANSSTEIMEIYSNASLTVHKMSIDSRSAVLQEPIELNAGDRLLHYYFDGKKQIKMKLTLEQAQHLDWQIQSHSTDLLDRAEFDLEPRPSQQIPKAFIKSDNTIAVQSFSFSLD
jgi:hypothetical protein